MARRDGLFIGISLIGLVWVISGIPDVVQVMAKSIWYAEASRQAMFQQMIRQSAEGLIRSILSIGVGVALIVSARTLSVRLDTD